MMVKVSISWTDEQTKEKIYKTKTNDLTTDEIIGYVKDMLKQQDGEIRIKVLND